MDLFTITAVIVVLSAMFGYFNARFLKLPNTIGLMVIAILFTLVVIASSFFSDRPLAFARSLIAQIDFGDVVLEVMLGFLLFAGALHTNFAQLKVQRWPVLVFSTVGVLVSTFLIAGATFFVFRAIDLDLKFIHCLLFGALISPTDPIAVLGILKKANVPKKLETKIVGESLFNDGVGVVIFMTILSIAIGRDNGATHVADSADSHALPAGVVETKPDKAQEKSENAAEDTPTEVHKAGDDAKGQTAHGETTMFGVIKFFVEEVVGGIILGLVLGFITFLLMRSIDNYEIEVLITLACVMGGYALAMFLHFSAPLTVVVAGLVVGNDTMRGSAMSQQTEDYVDQFWEMLDMLLNAALFVLIGLEILVLSFEGKYMVAALLGIAIVLLSRYCSLLVPVRFFRKQLDFVPFTTTIMTWGGLRGGISIALALSIPAQVMEQSQRDLLLTVTYGVVVFSIIVQGLTVGPLAKRLIGENFEQAT